MSGSPAGRSIVDALPAQQGVFALGQRRDAVEEQPRRPAPYRDIAMLQTKPLWLVAALDAAEHKDSRQPERDRNDRRAKVFFVLVLVQGHARTRLIAVDQAGVRCKTVKAALVGCPPRQFAKAVRHRRPGFAALGIDAVIAIAAAV